MGKWAKSLFGKEKFDSVDSIFSKKHKRVVDQLSDSEIKMLKRAYAVDYMYGHTFLQSWMRLPRNKFKRAYKHLEARAKKVDNYLRNFVWLYENMGETIKNKLVPNQEEIA